MPDDICFLDGIVLYIRYLQCMADHTVEIHSPAWGANFPKPKTSKINCSPGCGVEKRIAPQAKNKQNKLLPRLWSGKKNRSPGQKRAKQTAPQAVEREREPLQMPDEQKKYRKKMCFLCGKGLLSRTP